MSLFDRLHSQSVSEGSSSYGRLERRRAMHFKKTGQSYGSPEQAHKRTIIGSRHADRHAKFLDRQVTEGNAGFLDSVRSVLTPKPAAPAEPAPKTFMAKRNRRGGRQAAYVSTSVSPHLRAGDPKATTQIIAPHGGHVDPKAATAPDNPSLRTTKTSAHRAVSTGSFSPTAPRHPGQPGAPPSSGSLAIRHKPGTLAHTVHLFRQAKEMRSQVNTPVHVHRNKSNGKLLISTRPQVAGHSVVHTYESERGPGGVIKRPVQPVPSSKTARKAPAGGVVQRPGLFLLKGHINKALKGRGPGGVVQRRVSFESMGEQELHRQVDDPADTATPVERGLGPASHRGVSSRTMSSHRWTLRDSGIPYSTKHLGDGRHHVFDADGNHIGSVSTDGGSHQTWGASHKGTGYIGEYRSHHAAASAIANRHHEWANPTPSVWRERNPKESLGEAIAAFRSISEATVASVVGPFMGAVNGQPAVDVRSECDPERKKRQKLGINPKPWDKHPVGNIALIKRTGV